MHIAGRMATSTAPPPNLNGILPKAPVFQGPTMVNPVSLSELKHAVERFDSVIKSVTAMLQMSEFVPSFLITFLPFSVLVSAVILMSFMCVGLLFSLIQQEPDWKKRCHKDLC